MKNRLRILVGLVLTVGTIMVMHLGGPSGCGSGEDGSSTVGSDSILTAEQEVVATIQSALGTLRLSLVATSTLILKDIQKFATTTNCPEGGTVTFADNERDVTFEDCDVGDVIENGSLTFEQGPPVIMNLDLTTTLADEIPFTTTGIITIADEPDVEMNVTGTFSSTVVNLSGTIQEDGSTMIDGPLTVNVNGSAFTECQFTNLSIPSPADAEIIDACNL